MSKVYLNVILKTIFLVLAFGGLSWGLKAAGAGPVILPLGGAIGVGFLNIAQEYGNRAEPFKGKWSPFNVNSNVLFYSAWFIIGESTLLGLTPFMEYQTAAILSVADALAGGANAAVIQTLLLFYGPPVASSLALIMSFAIRDALVKGRADEVAVEDDS